MPYSLSHALKTNIYKIVPKSWLYQQGKLPNILLYSSRRGGSSYLAGLIAMEPGIRLIDQPFDLFKPDTPKGGIKAKYLPAMSISQFVSLNAPEEKEVEKYIDILLNGRERMISEPTFSRMNRTLLKIVNAMALINWLGERFKVKTVFLVRHPIAQGMSIIKNRWKITAGSYLENESFEQCYLTLSQRSLGYQILEHGSDLEKAVLNWIFENIVPLKHAKKVDLFITYEELVLNSEATINLIADKLELRNIQRIKTKVNVPSSSSGFSTENTLRAIQDGDRSTLVNIWMNQVDKVELKKIQELLAAFEIDEYEAESCLPHERLLNFS